MGNLLSPQRALYETNANDHIVALFDVQRAYWSLTHDDRSKLNYMRPKATNYDLEYAVSCYEYATSNYVDMEHKAVKCHDNNSMLKDNFKFYKPKSCMLVHMTAESAQPWQFMVLTDEIYQLLFLKQKRI